MMQTFLSSSCHFFLWLSSCYFRFTGIPLSSSMVIIKQNADTAWLIYCPVSRISAIFQTETSSTQYITRNVCITKYARLYKVSNGIMVMTPQGNHVAKFDKNPIYRTKVIVQKRSCCSKILFIVTVSLTFDLMTPK